MRTLETCTLAKVALMAYQFESHLRGLSALKPVVPLLLLIQVPEALLGLLWRYLETHWAQHPYLVLLVLYPPYCVLSFWCSALSFGVIRQLKTQTVSEAPLLQSFLRSYLKIAGAALILGLVFVPSVLLIIPGVILLAFYLYLPFILWNEPELSVSQAFGRSKALAKNYFGVSSCTAIASFLFSAVTPFLLSLVENRFILGWGSLVVELACSIALTFVLNIWTTTLFLEVSES